MRTRVAAAIVMNGGLALMHRKNVQKKEGSNQPYGEYFVFPGGGMEPDDTSLEDGVIREVEEEFGIIVKPVKQLFYRKPDDTYEEYLFLAEYVSGTFGTGTGPEFSGDPKYAHRGQYIPEIVPLEKIKEIRLIPEDFKPLILKELGLE